MKWRRERKSLLAVGNSVNGKADHSYLSLGRRIPSLSRMCFPKHSLALDNLGMSQPESNKKKALGMDARSAKVQTKSFTEQSNSQIPSTTSLVLLQGKKRNYQNFLNSNMTFLIQSFTETQ